MNNDWLDEVKEKLAAESNRESGILLERLQLLGIVNEQGEVTGHVHRWRAFRCITEVTHGESEPGKIAEFRCFNPVFGIPGGATTDIPRDSMVDYLKAGKKIITATYDRRLDMWREGSPVRLSESGFIQTESTNGSGDNVGSLPEFPQSNSRV